MEENKYSELDKLFRSRLVNPSDDGDWNVPPGEVFDAALDEINGGNSRRRFLLFLWISLAGLILTISALICWNIRTLGSIDQKMDEILAAQQGEVASQTTEERLPEENTSEVNEIEVQNESANNNGAPATETSGGGNSIDHSQKANSEAGQTPTANIAAIDNKDNRNKEEPFWPIIGPDGQYDSDPAEQENLPVTTAASDSIEAFAGLQSIGLLGFPYFFDPLPYSIDQNSIEHNERDSIVESKKPAVLFAFGPSLSTLNMISDDALPASLTKYDKWYSGYQMQLGLVQKLNKKWDAVYGIEYQRFTNQSEFREEHSYVKANEVTNNQGEQEYMLNLDLLTPIGIHSENMMVPVGNNSISDREEIVHITDMKNRFDVAGLHAGLRYHFIERKALNFYVNGGLAANYFLSVNEQMSTKLYYENRMLKEFVADYSTKGQLGNLFVRGNLGLGMDYRLTSHLNLGLNITGASSLNSIQKPSSVKLHVRQAGALFSATYRF